MGQVEHPDLSGNRSLVEVLLGDRYTSLDPDKKDTDLACVHRRSLHTCPTTGCIVLQDAAGYDVACQPFTARLSDFIVLSGALSQATLDEMLKHGLQFAVHRFLRDGEQFQGLDLDWFQSHGRSLLWVAGLTL